MSNVIRLALAAVICGTALSFSGCVGIQEQTGIGEVAGLAVSGSGPVAGVYTEAFIEYVGPQARWAGPPTFLLHVQAHDQGAASISVTPAFFNEVKIGVRKLASDDAAVTGQGTAAQGTLPMTGEKAREHLANLASALDGKTTPFTGCLSPVRVRLVRQDGSVLEKSGCRGHDEWTKAVSETMNLFLSAGLNNAG